jgi:catechol 2,3-dioxygenase-like lactoylglutathione lyase family enzyme
MMWVMTGSANGIGTLHCVVLDCPDPDQLATFYQELLGLNRVVDGADWISIGDVANPPGIAFQRATDFAPPTWPDPGVPQQAHFDIRVDDLDEAESRALALGARRLPGGGEEFRVFADPVGHPFCLFSH